MVVGVVLHLTHQIEIAGGNHGRRIVKATTRRWSRLWKSRSVENYQPVFHSTWKSRSPRGIPTFPPPRRRRSSPAPQHQQQFHLSSPLLAQTLQPRQGDTMCVGSPIQVFVFTISGTVAILFVLR